MIVLDTSVLVYAVGADHDFRDPCRRLVEAIGAGAISATTSIEVIQEFTHVRSRRRDREDAVTYAIAYVDLLSPLIATDGHQLRDGLTIFRDVAEVGSFDAVLAATALSAKATMVSADNGYAMVPGLAFVVPDAKGVNRLLNGG